MLLHQEKDFLDDPTLYYLTDPGAPYYSLVVLEVGKLNCRNSELGDQPSHRLVWMGEAEAGGERGPQTQTMAPGRG